MPSGLSGESHDAHDTRRLAVLVLGMHRSGTSLATEILSRLGLWIGTEQTLIGASEYNPRGHFELLAGVEFNNEALRQAGGTWDRPPAIVSVDALATSIRPAVDAWFDGRAPFAFKDPRLCLTLPVWMPALAAFDVRIVQVVRDPHAVARSLVTRSKAMDLPASRLARGEMTASHALTLWSEYNRRASFYVERFAVPRLFVSYDELVESPAIQVRRIAAFSDCRTEHIDAAVQCVRPELRRHRA
jgi:hypothetical protein